MPSELSPVSVSLIDRLLQITQREVKNSQRQDDGQSEGNDQNDDPLRQARIHHLLIGKVPVDHLHDDAVPEIYIDGMGAQVGQGFDPVVGRNENEGPDQEEGQQVEARPVNGTAEDVDPVIALKDLRIGHLSGKQILQEGKLVREAVA